MQCIKYAKIHTNFYGGDSKSHDLLIQCPRNGCNLTGPPGKVMLGIPVSKIANEIRDHSISIVMQSAIRMANAYLFFEDDDFKESKVR